MAKKVYVGVSDTARNVKAMYVGVNGVARKIIKAYVGVNGVARQFYESVPPYTELNYLESSGTQYIDTGVVPNFSKGIEFKFKANVTSQTDVGIALVRANVNGQYRCFGALNHSGSKFYIMKTKANSSLYNTSANTSDHTIRYGIKNGSAIYAYYDNTNLGSLDSYTEDLPYNLLLFARNWSGNIGKGKYRIYYCKIMDNQTNELIRDFIPVLDQNNVPCLYDKVTNEFYYNAGTGNFLYG